MIEQIQSDLFDEYRNFDRTLSFVRITLPDGKIMNGQGFLSWSGEPAHLRGFLEEGNEDLQYGGYGKIEGKDHLEIIALRRAHIIKNSNTNEFDARSPELMISGNYVPQYETESQVRVIYRTTRPLWLLSSSEHGTESNGEFNAKLKGFAFKHGLALN